MKKKKYVICKTCGYIVEEGKVHDVCPACGVPAGAFDPYTPVVTANRESVLSLHMHPIILHFTQAIVVVAFALAFLALIFPDNPFMLLYGAQVHTIFLPVFVIAGALSGMIDGKYRFKSIGTPLLVRKIILSCIFLVLSLISGLLALFVGMTDTVLIVILVLDLISCIVAVVLGKMGSPLVTAVYPG